MKNLHFSLVKEEEKKGSIKKINEILQEKGGNFPLKHLKENTQYFN